MISRCVYSAIIAVYFVVSKSLRWDKRGAIEIQPELVFVVLCGGVAHFDVPFFLFNIFIIFRDCMPSVQEMIRLKYPR